MNLRAYLVAGVIALGAVTAPAVHAAAIDVNELPGAGAGNLPGTAQVMPGVAGTAIGSISGTLATQDDVDLYQIAIAGSFFGATTSGSAASDLGLWLFDQSGRGVVWDAGGTFDGVNPQALLALVGPTPGVYFLAVGRALNLPRDTNGDPIFDLFAPGGPLTTVNPLGSWDFSEGGDNIDRENGYVITFEAGAFAVPEPASAALLALGLLGGALTRRRRI